MNPADLKLFYEPKDRLRLTVGMRTVVPHGQARVGRAAVAS